MRFISGEEQNLLATLINLRPDFDVFSHLDGLFLAPVDHIDVPQGEETIPSLYLFVHFHLYVSVAALARGHLSECLVSTRKAIDATLCAYEMILHPASIPLYESRDKRFQYIKNRITKAREKDNTQYPLAAELLALHDICSEYGSHADISSLVHRVELQKAGQPGKSRLHFHYFQFPRDTDEYHAYFVETLLAYYHMLVVFKPLVLQRAIGLKAGWSAQLDKVGAALEKEREMVYRHFAVKDKPPQQGPL